MREELLFKNIFNLQSRHYTFQYIRNNRNFQFYRKTKVKGKFNPVCGKRVLSMTNAIVFFYSWALVKNHMRTPLFTTPKIKMKKTTGPDTALNFWLVKKKKTVGVAAKIVQCNGNKFPQLTEDGWKDYSTVVLRRA